MAEAENHQGHLVKVERIRAVTKMGQGKNNFHNVSCSMPTFPKYTYDIYFAWKLHFVIVLIEPFVKLRNGFGE